MVRTRFAPSPTGHLHIGSARTALYAWLFAKHHQGQFILRIEDTDRARSTDDSIQTILEGLAWLGIDYDEGPYFQSRRSAHYQAALEKLLHSGEAYFCYCSIERLHALRETQLAQGQKPRYDGYCRHRTAIILSDQPSVIRFRNPEHGRVVIDDKILGAVKFNNTELDDFILARSDGTPTYNFTVVVDDYEMAITHVIRGNDHLNNTPRQVNVLKALGAPIPVYMHLPMLHSMEGKKISKRAGAASVIDYQYMGILPETVTNYLARLGWSHGNQEIFSKEELIQYFNGSHLSKSPGILNYDKLLWLNQYYLRRADPAQLEKALTPFTTTWEWDGHPKAPLLDIILAQRDRVKTLKEMAEKSRFFYEKPIQACPAFSNNILSPLQSVYFMLAKLDQWETPMIYSLLMQIIDYYQLKPNQLFQPLRMLLVGAIISPPMDVTIQLLGKIRVLDRLQIIKGP